MIGIVCASHGLMAEGIVDSVKMFCDGQQIESVCLLPSMDLAQFISELKQKINAVNTGEGVILFIDLLFGTPCNMSAKFLADPNLKDNLHIVTGLNLPMLLEAVTSRSNGQLDINHLIQVGIEGIVNFNDKIKKV